MKEIAKAGVGISCFTASSDPLPSMYNHVSVTKAQEGSAMIAKLIVRSVLVGSWLGIAVPSCEASDPTIGLVPPASDSYPNWSAAGLNAIPLTGTISGTTLTVTYSPSLALGVGQTIVGSGVVKGTTITAAANDPSSNSLTGTGGKGTYTVSISQTTVGSIAMTASGIPNRCASNSTSCISATLSPSGADDTAAIQKAINACLPGKVVRLTAGVFHLSANRLNIYSPNPGCTVRGAGPGQQLSTGLNKVDGDSSHNGATFRGCTSGTKVSYGDGSFCTDSTATQIVKTDRATNTNAIFNVQGTNGWKTTYNLSNDAVQGALSVTLSSTPSGINPGDMVWIDELSLNGNKAIDPNVWWSTNDNGFNGNLQGFGMRVKNSSIGDAMEVASIKGDTVTFDTPIIYPYKTAYKAALTTYPSNSNFVHGVGLENMFVWGGTQSNISMIGCAYCWVKNVESMWSTEDSVNLSGTYRSVLRDSFLHETDLPTPGGAGYMLEVSGGGVENLIENNQIWYGNKVDVTQSSGGGNVLAYNYMDDAFGDYYPELPEAGITAGHETTPHMILFEGNYSPNFQADDYHGNTAFNTVFRNWFSGIRGSSTPEVGHEPLLSYKNGTNCYWDAGGNSRTAVQMGGWNYYHNFVGNVLGTSAGILMPQSHNGCSSSTQKFTLQITNMAQYTACSWGGANCVPMWQIGGYEIGSDMYWESGSKTALSTLTRTANWDWLSSAESCYAFGGTTNISCSGVTVPNSFYLASKPAFFGTQTWPWVDPTTGKTYTLPAMYCFQHNKMPTCLQSSGSTGGGPTVTVQVTAVPSTLPAKGKSTISWTSTNATSCSTNGFTGHTDVSYSKTVSVPYTQNYTVTCTGTAGTASGTAKVTVN